MRHGDAEPIYTPITIRFGLDREPNSCLRTRSLGGGSHLMLLIGASVRSVMYRGDPCGVGASGGGAMGAARRDV